MAKCSRCGQKARFMMAMCDACIDATAASRGAPLPTTDLGTQVTAQGNDSPSTGQTDDAALGKDLWWLLFAFEGRIGRSDFYKGVVPVLLPLIVATLVMVRWDRDLSGVVSAVLYWVLLLATPWPTLALHAKRLHDRNHSAWWLVTIPISVVSMVGVLAALVGIWLTWNFIAIYFLKGTAGPNRFGQDPLRRAVRPVVPAAKQHKADESSVV